MDLTKPKDPLQSGYCTDENGEMHNDCSLTMCLDGCIREKVPNPTVNYNPLEDRNNKISSLAIVHHNVEMGKGNVIMEGAIIREGVTMGDNNYIGPYCIIGDPAEKIGYFDKPGRVVIGDGNRFTKQVTIDAGTEKATTIGSGTILLKNAHVGHDAHIMSDVILSCNVCIGGHTTVWMRTNFGMGAAAHQRLEIPPGCMIGMNSTITKKTKMSPNKKYAGSPAREIGDNQR